MALAALQAHLQSVPPVFLIAPVALLLLSYVVKSFQRRQALRRMAAEHGCKPIRLAYNKLPFALDRKWKIITYKGNVLDDLLTTRFVEVGNYLFTDASWGSPPIICAEPEAIKSVLATNFKDWITGDERHKALGPWLGRGIFLSNHGGGGGGPGGDLWATARGLLRPGFAHEDVYDLAEFERQVREMLLAMPVGADGWTTVPDGDMLPLVRRFALDMTTSVFLGGNINSQRKSIHGAAAVSKEEKQDIVDLEDAFDEVNVTSTWRLRAGPLYWLFDSKVYRAACATLAKLGDERVARAVAGRDTYRPGERDGDFDFVRQLAAGTDDRILMRDLLAQMLFAGIDTTTSMLCFTIVELARTPGAWDRLRAELAAQGMLDPSSDPAASSITTAKLKSCHFLQHALTETLRLYPAIPVNTREAARDTVLPVGGGEDGRSPILVEKGTVMKYSVYVMHRRADLFGPDALEWKPDRWVGRRHGWDYVPFNGGPRICLGQKFSLSEGAYMLARLAQTFDKIEPTIHEPRVTTQFKTALFPAKGVPVRFHKAVAAA